MERINLKDTSLKGNISTNLDYGLNIVYLDELEALTAKEILMIPMIGKQSFHRINKCLVENGFSPKTSSYVSPKCLRDEIAMKAMQGELSSQDFVTIAWANEKELAERSYRIADAMMQEREKDNETF